MSSLRAEEWSGEQILELYRIRWQVEMLFKRLKGVLNLDGLRAKDPELVQQYLLGKLLGAVILEGWTKPVVEELFDWSAPTVRPPSFWRCWVWWKEALCCAIRGYLSPADFQKSLPKLKRYLRDEPRKRSQKLTAALIMFRRLGGNGNDLMMNSTALLSLS